MKLPFLDFVKRRFHYELDKAQEEYNRALGRMENGEFERGFIAGLERGLYLLEDSKYRWGNNPLDMDDDENSEEGEAGSGSESEGSESSGGSSTGQEGSSGSGNQSSGSSSGGSSAEDSDSPELDMPLDAMTQ